MKKMVVVYNWVRDLTTKKDGPEQSTIPWVAVISFISGKVSKDVMVMVFQHS